VCNACSDVREWFYRNPGKKSEAERRKRKAKSGKPKGESGKEKVES
jgi:hypothetical protein